MNKKEHSRPATVALAATLASCCAALAAPGASAQAFVAASVGRTNWGDLPCTDTITCDRHPAGGTVRAGYRFLPWLAVEARYFDLGKAHTVSPGGTVLIELPDVMAEFNRHADYRAKGAGIDLVASWPIADRVSLSAMAGIARSEAHSESHADFPPGSRIVEFSFPATQRSTNPYYGIGFSYAVTPRWALSLEAERYRIDFGGTTSIDQFAAGLAYEFR